MTAHIIQNKNKQNNTQCFILWVILYHIQHYNDVIKSAMASQITRVTIVYSIGYTSADQRRHQSSAWLAFVRGIHRWPVNSPHKVPVTRKMFPFDDVIMRIPLPVIWSDHQLAGKSDNSQMYRAFASSVIKRQSFYSSLLNHAISARRSHSGTNIYECYYGD